MKKYIFLAILCTVSFSVFSQNNSRTISISYGYNENTWEPLKLRGSATGTPSEWSVTASSDLLWLNDKWSFGLYVGSGRSSYYSSADSTLVITTAMLRYGINAKLHLLPAIGSGSEHWDVSLSGTIGSMWCHGTTLQTEYGLGLSLAYYPFKHVGITAEYLWGNFKCADYNTVKLYESSQFIKAGLSYRF